MIHWNAKIHPQACVDRDKCHIGDGTRVWQFASIIRDASIGDNCSIGSCAVVDMAFIGDRCSIGHGAQVHPGVLIGSGVFVGPGAIFCNDMWPSVSKDGWDYDHLGAVPVIQVDDGASIGAGVIIMPGVRIGKNAMVAAGAVVTKDVPAGELWLRNGMLQVTYTRKDRMRFVR